MKRFYQTLLLCLVIPLWTHAQDTTTFSLDDCIRYALENTVEVKNAHVDEDIATAKVRETTGIGLPQVDGSVSINHNAKLPRFFSTKAVSFGFSGLPEEEYPNYLPGLADDDVVASPNFFQLKSSANAGITVNQLLFNASYLVGLKAASTYKELAIRSSAQTEIDVVQNVTKAYYGVLVNNERITLFDNNIARVDSLLRTTAALNKNGFAEEIDVDRIRVTLNNLKSERLKFVNNQALALGLLKFQMNFPMSQSLQVSGSLANLKVNENLFNEYQQGWDYSNRIEFKLLETQRKLQELDIKNKYSQSMPNLSAFANLGYSTQSPNIGGLFVTKSDIKDSGVIGPDKWYPYTTFGLTLNVPIFSGLQRNYKIQQAKMELLKIRNREASLKQSIDLSIEQNTITFKNAIETLNSQQENLVLADKVARVTKIKYEQGVGSNIEVIDAESSLRESQVNYYNALFDAILAKIDLDKAYAKIDPTKYALETKE
jgi:outer membrane protein TolC